jgi:F1F0 ATPase subunit 2
MAITDAMTWIMNGAALLVGIGAGTLFFGGLWWTVSRKLDSGQPGSWFMGSFLVRAVITALAFVLIGRDHPDRLAACLLGFLCARAVIVRRLRPQPSQTGGREHAS